MKSWKYFMMTTMVGSALALGACGDDAETTEKETPTEEVTTDTAEEPEAVLKGDVSGDGSSTVAPIMEALVEEYAGVQEALKLL